MLFFYSLTAGETVSPFPPCSSGLCLVVTMRDGLCVCARWGPCTILGDSNPAPALAPPYSVDAFSATEMTHAPEKIPSLPPPSVLQEFCGPVAGLEGIVQQPDALGQAVGLLLKGRHIHRAADDDLRVSGPAGGLAGLVNHLPENGELQVQPVLFRDDVGDRPPVQGGWRSWCG